jgi:predicted nucleic acid-binding protein
MKLRVYLDTSVISAYLDDRTPERKRETVGFWYQLNKYDVQVSELTVTELQATRDPATREQMMVLIHSFTVLPLSEEARVLAQHYLSRGVFSVGMMEDALHVAVAVVSRCEIVVSWNFKHLVNRRRRALVNESNVLMDYPPIDILAPPEL